MMKTLFTPGRTELAGNHTDHQYGRVLAAAIDRGVTAEDYGKLGAIGSYHTAARYDGDHTLFLARVGQELQKKATDTLQVNQQEDPNDDLPF